MSPFYENNGNKYYFFYFLDRNLKNDIIDKINNKNNSFSKDNDKIEYKINKCNIVKNPKTILAFMSVIFNDNIEISCNILNGKYGLWVAWPSIKEKDKWIKLFNIKNKELKEEIETKLLKLYKQKKNDAKL
jgi:DNA-binding cell septation regulator SpoVG